MPFGRIVSMVMLSRMKILIGNLREQRDTACNVGVKQTSDIGRSNMPSEVKRYEVAIPFDNPLLGRAQKFEQVVLASDYDALEAVLTKSEADYSRIILQLE